MAKISLVISIIITLVTAGLGFMTNSRVQALQSSLSSTKSELGNTKTSLTKAQGDLKTRTEELATATKTIEDQKTQVAAAERAMTEAKAAADKAAQEVTAKVAEVERLTGELKKISDASGQPGGMNPTELAEKLAAMTEQLNKAQTDLAEARTLQETATRQADEARAQLSDANNRIKSYRENIVTSNLRGRVVAVNPGWNFVILSVGDRQGARVGATLLVTRGGQNVARVRITSVEPGQSVADVVPGSMARGQTVQPGDAVVFTGRQPGPPTTPEAPSLQPPAPAGGGQQPPAQPTPPQQG